MSFTVITRRFFVLPGVFLAACGVLYLAQQDNIFSQQWTRLRVANLGPANRPGEEVTSTKEKGYHSPLPKSTSESGRISAVYMGRTGNWIQIYAGLYGISQRNGMRHVIYANEPLLSLFRLNVTIIEDDEPEIKWHKHYLPDKGYDQRTEHLNPHLDVRLAGYLNDWQYRKLVMRDLIDNHFLFNDNVLEKADLFLQRSMALLHLSPSDVAVIAVHIRRSDRAIQMIETGHSSLVAERKYFNHAVAFFNRLFSNKTMYVVCSDDITWAITNFVTERPTAFSIGHGSNVDFAILSRCNHSILTVGTFGEWSAIIAGGVTVYHDVGAPSSVSIDRAYRKVNHTQDPRLAWIGLS